MYLEKGEHVDKSIQKPFHGKYNLIDLSKMMTFGRPARSRTEEVFINKYIDIVPNIKKDPYGNRFIKIGKKPTTLFTSHTDTVHSEYFWKGHPKFKNMQIMGDSKNEKQRYPVKVSGKWLSQKAKEDVLGADDTTGVWMMLNLIDAKKPGLYIFHRDEEVGGKGSRYIAESKPELLHGIQRAVSFDRKGYSDIITHQRGERTASDKFAKELSNRLGGGFQTAHGTFTDSANYYRIVPECTNLSVGFKDAHTKDEKQNLKFARHLLGKVIEADFETLPSFRDPKKVEERPASYFYINDFWNDDANWRDVYTNKNYPEKKKKREIKERKQYLKSINKEIEEEEESKKEQGRNKNQYLIEKTPQRRNSQYMNVPRTDSDLYDDYEYLKIRDWIEKEKQIDKEKPRKEPYLPI